MKKVFISYSHKQGRWVWERLVPVLRAAGCGAVLLDKERFIAGRGVKGQMDSTQDQAEVTLLVLTPGYLRSDYCCHEMERAIAADPGFTCGKVLPIKRVNCDMSAFQPSDDPPLWVDLANDHDPGPWALLLRSLEADELKTEVPHWLDVRDQIVQKLCNQHQSVNLVIRGEPNWRALRDHFREDWLPKLAVVDLDDPRTASLQGLVTQILTVSGCKVDIPKGARSVEALSALESAASKVFLALTHFENVQARKRAYGVDLFFTLRHLTSDERKLVLLVESRTPFKELFPRDHPLSGLHLDTIELRGS
jgi:hypothetical protein